MTNTYSVFQTEADLAATSKPASRLRAFGFVGRVLEGASIIVWSLLVSVVALTSTAQASAVLADTTANHPALVAAALIGITVFMLVMVRRTWRHTSKGIANAPRRLHQIG